MFPLFTLPFLSRILGPSGFGLLVIGQALANYLQLVLEYGFALSGTREVAQSKKDRVSLSRILRGVLGAKVLLLFPSAVLAAIGYWALPQLKGQEEMVLAAFFSAISSVLSPVWFFQGLERMRNVAYLEFFSRALATLAVFAFIRSEKDAYLVLVFNGFAGLVSGFWGLTWLWRELGFSWPSIREGLLFLRLGFNLFMFRVLVSFYTAANPLILGFFVPATQVGFYAGTERLTKALLSLWDPLSRVFFPLFSRLVRENPLRASALGRKIFWIMLGVGLGAAGIVALIAPWLVRWLLGPAFIESVPIMRILSLLLPLIALSNFLGIQWMLSWRMDRVFNLIIGLAGVANLVLGTTLTYFFGTFGMAWAAVLVEAWVTGAMLLYLWRVGKLPWGLRV